MTRYLNKDEMQSRLRFGKSVAQWLSVVQGDNYTVLKWLSIGKEKDDFFSVTYFESFDEGKEDFMDIYAFSLVDPDAPFGVIYTFSSIVDALDFAELTYIASPNKYTAVGGIQEEYRDYIKRQFLHE